MATATRLSGHNRGMKEPVYAAARVIAPAVSAHFTDHVTQAEARGETRLASIPTSIPSPR